MASVTFPAEILSGACPRRDATVEDGSRET